MRALILTFALCVPVVAHAGLLDLLPLKKIERKILYPLSQEEVAPSALRLSDTKVHALERDGHKLIVWTVRAKGPSNPSVLYFHGNAGNLASRAQRFAEMQNQGINVIAMSYRGSSGSDGLPSEPAITSDALYIFQNLETIAPWAHPEKLILYGESLGSAVAISLLASISTAERPAGVILEAPFTSTPEMARTMMDVPEKLIARISDRWDSLSRAFALTIPMTVLHGTQDEVTPNAMGRAIFQAAPVTDKNFIAVRGASHSSTWRSDTMPKLWRFIHAYGGK